MYISISDSLQLASKLTRKRINNAYQIYSSFQRSSRNRVANINGLPISISVEPTTACNLRCPECPSGLRSFTRPTGKMSGELFQNLIDQVGGQLLYMLFYFQGEPYLHPDLNEMIQCATQKGIYTSTSTNAHFLDDQAAKSTIKSGLNRIIISIDGATQETYESYRKTGKLDQVLVGTERLIYWKKKMRSSTPHIVWQFLVVKPNEHEIPAIKKLARQYGVNHVAFKTAQIYDYKHGNPLIPDNEKYARYTKGSDGTYEVKNKMLDECWKMWHSCVVTWDGRVVPCCFDKDAQYVLGNLAEQSFEEIWQSTSYDDFRNQLLNSRDQIEMCKNCTEGTKVWA